MDSIKMLLLDNYSVSLLLYECCAGSTLHMTVHKINHRKRYTTTRFNRYFITVCIYGLPPHPILWSNEFCSFIFITVPFDRYSILIFYYSITFVPS